MANPKGFILIPRKEAGYRPLNERIYDYGEVEQTLGDNDRIDQASRCMDCGVPFCHWGCPVGSLIPEWQEEIYKGRWKEAYDILHATNPFPEITGRVCPAPCEKSCVLSINDGPVTIRENEASTVEHAFGLGLVEPRIPKVRTGKKVAIVGSGPAGLAAADRLNQAGHWVTVYEKDSAIGGLLRFGIPDFKLGKNIIDRRLTLFHAEGIRFHIGITVGKDIGRDELLGKFDAVLIATGAGQPRDLNVEGRNLQGIHFAMDFLSQQNRRVAGEIVPARESITAKGKKVVVIGGGDTGSDCVGTAIRQRAVHVTQIEILPQPPVGRALGNPWPWWPETLRTSSSHLEGCERRWGLSTLRFTGSEGKVKGMEAEAVEWTTGSDCRRSMTPVPGSHETFGADLVLLALGFTQPVHHGLLDDLGVSYDERGNVRTGSGGMTSVEKVFACGDAVSGASLVVKAIESGKAAAANLADWLKKD